MSRLPVDTTEVGILKNKGHWLALVGTGCVAAIPALDVAQAAVALLMVIAYVAATVTVLRKRPTLGSTHLLFHLGVSVALLTLFVLIAEAVTSGGQPRFPNWSDATAPPGTLALWVGLVVAIRARSATSRLGDVCDALTISLLLVAVVVFTTYSYFTGPDTQFERAVNFWFLISDVVLLCLTMVLVLGSGVRNSGARWLGAAGFVGAIYGLTNTFAIAQSESVKGDLTRFLALIFVLYAIAVRQDDYADFATRGTRPQVYRWYPYPITGLALTVSFYWVDAKLVVVALAVFVALASSRVAIDSLAANRLTTINGVTGNLARQLSLADSPPKAIDAGVGALQQLLPNKKLSVETTVTGKVLASADLNLAPLSIVPSTLGSTQILVAGTIPQYLVVAFEQIADILDFALPTIDDRMRQAELASIEAIRDAEEAAEAGWQSLNVDSHEVPLLAKDGKILRVGQNALTMLGFDPVGYAVDKIPALMHQNVGAGSFEDPSQSGRWLEVSHRIGADDSAIYTIRDVTENVVSARTDPTTGLANQAAFEASESLTNRIVTVVFVHDFDRISETSGKPEAEGMLCEIADRCRRHFRDEAEIWRGTGPKIIVISRLSESDDWVDDRRRTLAAPLTIGDDIIAPAITIGAARIEESLTPVAALLRADMALNEARLKNPYSTRWYSQELREAAKRSWSVESAFVKALADPDKSGLYVVYQPLIRAADSSPAACEALIRWNHPTLGNIGPDEFIPIAERMGIVDRIDRFVLQKALVDIGKFHVLNPDLKIHSNLSPVGLNPEKLQLLSAVLAPHSTTNSMVLEITESSIGSQNLSELQQACKLILATGVSISLDDFGTGESNFDRIAKLPLSEVKLSKHFAESGDPVMVGGVIQTIHRLGMECVAENVETKEQLDMLVDVGVDYLQGYYFSPPKLIGDILSWMERCTTKTAASSGDEGQN